MAETCGFWNKSCCIPGRLDGRIAIVTGSDGGLGFYITTELARRGATVIMTSLDVSEGEQARKQMLDKYGESNPNAVNEDIASESMKQYLSPIKGEQLIVEHINLASLASVRAFVKKFLQNHSKLHYLINNAGLESLKYRETEDGFEMTFGVNYLGHFLLTELLIPILKQSAPSRIISVSSVVHYNGQLNEPDIQLSRDKYKSFTAYCDSKLAIATYMSELGHRLAGTGVLTASLHPGVINTSISNHLSMFARMMNTLMVALFGVSPWQAIQTVLYTLQSQSIESGGYYSNCTLKQPSKIVQDKQVQDWLRKKSSELVGLESNTADLSSN